MDDTILASIQPNATRRFVGLATMWALALVLFGLAIKNEPSFGTRILLMVMGGLTVFWAEGVRRATRLSIILSDSELVDSSGRVLARMEDIQRVDRSFFAFKPSNGFIIITTKPAPRVWAPGLFWRIGRRVGVGGVTSVSQTKNMADIIALRLAERGLQGPA